MKYSDVTSTVAIVIALVAAFINYHENEVTRLETNRPRISVNVEVDQKMTIVDDKSVLLWIPLEAQNIGQTNALNVRGELSLVKTNSPGYARDKYAKDLSCSAPISALSDILYPGKSAGASFGLSTSAIHTYVNMDKDYLFRGVYQQNSDFKYVVLGCVTYNMVSDDVKFTEEVLFDISSFCSDGVECDIFGDYSKHGVPKKIFLHNVMF